MNPDLQLQPTDEPRWYCVRTLSKRETQAAINMRADLQLEVFAPRLIYKKKTRRGVVKFNDALFPGYIFVHCLIRDLYRKLISVTGIISVVHYGPYIPYIPDEFIMELKTRLGGETHEILEPPLQKGETVQVVEGPFKELEAIISTVVPGKDRVLVLVEILGRLMEVEFPASAVLRNSSGKKRL